MVLSQLPIGESARVMGKVKWSSGQSTYSWEWGYHSYWIATQSAFDNEAGTRLLVVPRR